MDLAILPLAITMIAGPQIMSAIIFVTQRIDYLLINYLWEGYALEVNSEAVRNKKVTSNSRARIEGELSIGDSTGGPYMLGALRRLNRDRQNGKG